MPRDIYTKTQLEAALKAADAAGDVEAAKKLASAYKMGLYSMDKPETDYAAQREAVGGGQLGIATPLGRIDTSIDMPQGVTEALAGAGRRLSQIGSLGTHKGDPKADALLNDSGYAMLGSVGADVASLKGLQSVGQAAGAIPKVGQAISGVTNAISRPSNLGQSALGGAAYGAATTEDRAENAIAGLAGGAMGYGVTKALGGVASPKLQPGAEDLMQKGVKLTPGEMLGGWVQRIEDGATSIPFVGDFIKNAKRSSLKDFNRSIINDALEKIGSKLDDGIPIGREAIAHADDIISKQYDDVLSRMVVKADGSLARELATVNKMTKQLSPSQQRAFQNEYKNIVQSPLLKNKGTLLGDTFKQADSTLRTVYKKYLSSSKVSEQKVGEALQEVHASLMRAAQRQNPADVVAGLKKADTAYAMMRRVSDAASRAGSQDGIFTPNSLVAAVKKSASQKQFAAGRAMGQEIAEKAKGVLPSTVPDSGTPFRAGSMMAVGGAGYLDPSLAAGALGVSSMYSRPGIAASQYAIGKRPEVMRLLGDSIKQQAPNGYLLGAPLLINSE